ncbi:uncharacterized protein LOC108141013 [Drosophila elegans]|uniref:uncharacterized protein LOC108141013 n=1 Tax=Drosophila elegans TaxID=30023 RepID=UPI001BC82ED2|nr:uncharacterized protein LOC108141013 [Drosophila elegans]
MCPRIQLAFAEHSISPFRNYSFLKGLQGPAVRSRPSDMPVTTRASAPSIWSRPSPTCVAEITLIGDGPHVQRPRHSRPNPPSRQPMLMAPDQRPRTRPPRRTHFLRKMSLQRSLAFYSRLRNTVGSPPTGFGYLFETDFSLRRQLRRDSYMPVIGNWLRLPINSNEGPEGRRLFSERRHWERAQLHFQQYLGLRHRHHHSPRSFSLRFDLSSLDMKLIYGMLYGLGLREALRLAFNEVFYLH